MGTYEALVGIETEIQAQIKKNAAFPGSLPFHQRIPSSADVAFPRSEDDPDAQNAINSGKAHLTD
jgi:hypothetical protein